MSCPRCLLRQGREKSLLRRHLWVFSGALKDPDAPIPPGETVQLCDAAGTPLAKASWSPASQLRARVWSFDPAEEINGDFFRRRIARAAALRRELGVLNDSGGCRLIYSEGDMLPGVIVDWYAGFAAVQFLSAGAEKFRELISEILLEQPFIKGIYERSDSPVRAKEGLPERSGMIDGQEPPENLLIEENGLKFAADLRGGQKTGFYFDLRTARQKIRTLAAGKSVLNVFSYTGGFACAAFAGGAKNVLNIDASRPALEQCEKNLLLNGFTENWQNLCGDAFTLLRRLDDEKKRFDLVILDPPKLIPGKNAMLKGCRGYQDLARLGFKLLNPGGVLCNFSCSGLMEMPLFQKITADAALDAGKNARIICRLEQAPDHPTLLAVPETFYLKGLISASD